MPDLSNPRFVVTPLKLYVVGRKQLYENVYCARGEMENRIKEQQLYRFADRTSSSSFRANQTRLYFSSIAYLLLEALRRIGLAGTEMAKALGSTAWVAMAQACPYTQVVQTRGREPAVLTATKRQKTRTRWSSRARGPYLRRGGGRPGSKSLP